MTSFSGGEAGHLGNEHNDKRATGTATVGDKISGGVDKMMGEMTNNPNKVQEGQMKEAGGGGRF